MKTIKVVVAVICDSLENTTKIFATARGYGEFKGKWEFPGGKLEVGETSQQALIREIQEELDVKIEVGELIDTIEYDYPIGIHPFLKAERHCKFQYLYLLFSLACPF